MWKKVTTNENVTEKHLWNEYEPVAKFTMEVLWNPRQFLLFFWHERGWVGREEIENPHKVPEKTGFDPWKF